MNTLEINYIDYKNMINSLPNPLYINSFSSMINNSNQSCLNNVDFEVVDNKWKLVTKLNVYNENYENITCKITGLVKDKVSGDVAYNDLEHKYWNIKTGEFYTSVTSYLKQFQKPFDSELTSIYKAIEIEYNIWFQELKSKRLNMKQLVKEFKDRYFDNDIVKFKITEYSKHLRKLWQLNAYESAQKGTLEHKAREQLVYNNGKIILFDTRVNLLKQYKYSGQDISIDLNKDINLSFNTLFNCYPEQLVYSHKYKLAGQIDLLAVDNIVRNNKNSVSIDIYDYKTNKSIDMCNRFQVLKPPFNYIEDCNFNIYSMQLSLYSILVKEMFNFMKDYNVSLNLVHIKDTDNIYKDEYIKCRNFTDILLKKLDYEK